MNEEIVKRREWFANYIRRLEEGIVAPAQENTFYTCPGCGYPTLSERGAYEICIICGWEDDGQDDLQANEVWGGPNRDYSLLEARENFCQYLTMYRPGDRGFEESIKKTHLKRELISAYDEMATSEDSKEIQMLRERIAELERKL